ncbi:ComEA family DNA-binding protein [Paenibacillus guangzhouensis]|uniref:ComEA family DNA-binding protein n=1 Tax=Paenibacillus guangzhouensis TaxID=1473112 RepID=UPI001266A0D7|nr:ComEA family DNA-binding protein [Paenibacillus guangzhouensis]
MEPYGQPVSGPKSWILFSCVCIGVCILVFAWIHSTSITGIPGWTKLNEPMAQALAVEPPKPDVRPVSASGQAVQETQKPKAAASTIPEPVTSSGSANATAAEVSHNDTSGLIHINTATMEQLMELPGIGESKAKAIIAYREQHGKFSTIEGLRKVKGIGPKIYAKMQSKLAL